MQLERTQIEAVGHNLPAFLLTPDVPVAGTLVIHPYGGAKEHMLGIAEAIAVQRVAAVVPDLCGHGENHSVIEPRHGR
jgi:dienelactone hydrolase